jgi:hypothetical protein
MGCGRERIWMVIAWQKSVWLITPLALFPYVYEAVNPVFLRNSLHQGRLLASFPSRLPIEPIWGLYPGAASRLIISLTKHRLSLVVALASVRS